MTREEAIEIIRDARCTSPLRDALETLIPELRESEDERIRKFLITIVNNLCAPNFKDVERKGVLAYLEKQKEPTFISDLPPDDKGEPGEDGILEKQKDILSERANNITINMLEDGIEGIQRELIEFLSNTINAPWVDVIKSADAYAQRIRSMVEKQKEQKPADRFEEAREKYQVEWSEEDEKKLNDVIRIIKHCGMVESIRNHYIKFLESLSPQYHGDVTMTEAYKMGLEAGKASSWKPSKEQMDALQSAIIACESEWVYQDDELRSLLTDLKKLM